MIEIVTAPTGHYTDLATVKARLGIDGTDYDAMLTSMIASATSFINGYCRREMREQVVIETVPGSGEVTLNLQEFPVTSVEYVKVNESETEEYSLDTGSGVLHRDYGVWPMDRLGSGGAAPDPVGRTGRLNVEVKYTSGYSEIPYDISEAAIMYVTGMFHGSGSDIGITQKREGDLSIMYSITSGGALSYIEYIKENMLKPWRRWE